MAQYRLAPALKAAVLAGLAGGLGLGLFHLLFTEPVIDKALVIEHQFAAAEAEVVSRAMQKVGLLAGTVIFGAILGALFAGPYALFREWLPGASARTKVMALTLLAYWSVAFFPFLKYPANPPGVGEVETIAFRQAITFGFAALSVLGIAGAIAAYRLVERRSVAASRRKLVLGVMIGYLAYGSALYIFMPPNPDAVRMPMDLVSQFRWLSLAGLTLLWGILGTLFAVLWERFSRKPGAAVTAFARPS